MSSIFDRASQLVSLAQIIQDEEGCTPDEAYAMAERELEQVHTVRAAWSLEQLVLAGDLTITPTAWGLILRRGGVTTVIYPSEVAAVQAVLQAYQMRNEL